MASGSTEDGPTALLGASRSSSPRTNLRLAGTDTESCERSDAEQSNGHGDGKSTPVATGPTPGRSPKPSTLRRRLMLADGAALLVGILISFLVQAVVRPVPWFVVSNHILVAASSLPAFALGAGINHLYRARANESRLEEASNLLKTVALATVWIVILSLGVQYDDLSRFWVVAFVVSVSGSLLLERRIARAMFAKMRQGGQMRRRIVIIGTDSHALGLMRSYERNPSLGYEVMGLVGNDDLSQEDDVNFLGSTEELATVLDDQGAVGVVISLSSVASDEVNVLTRRLTDEGYHVALSSSLQDIDIGRLRPQALDGRTMIYVEPVVRNGWRAAAKRCFDLCLALLIMVLTLPIQIFTAFAIALSSRGPVFFRQIRVGKDGELFEVLKFRTMYQDAEERKAELMEHNEMDGPLFKMKNDPRITPVGRILRKLSIDELPQLFCVLIGSMSMVGPRPALPSEVEQWDDDVRDRLRVPPGLTGMWQVSGRSDSSFEQYKRMDLYYVDNWSLLHDVKICARTVSVVLTGSGAS